MATHVPLILLLLPRSKSNEMHTRAQAISWIVEKQTHTIPSMGQRNVPSAPAHKLFLFKRKIWWTNKKKMLDLIELYSLFSGLPFFNISLWNWNIKHCYCNRYHFSFRWIGISTTMLFVVQNQNDANYSLVASSKTTRKWTNEQTSIQIEKKSRIQVILLHSENPLCIEL